MLKVTTVVGMAGLFLATATLAAMSQELLITAVDKRKVPISVDLRPYGGNATLDVDCNLLSDKTAMQPESRVRSGGNQYCAGLTWVASGKPGDFDQHGGGPAKSCDAAMRSACGAPAVLSAVASYELDANSKARDADLEAQLKALIYTIAALEARVRHLEEELRKATGR
jgi:hypothetical protein